MGESELHFPPSHCTTVLFAASPSLSDVGVGFDAALWESRARFEALRFAERLPRRPAVEAAALMRSRMPGGSAALASSTTSAGGARRSKSARPCLASS